MGWRESKALTRNHRPNPEASGHTQPPTVFIAQASSGPHGIRLLRLGGQLLFQVPVEPCDDLFQPSDTVLRLPAPG